MMVERCWKNIDKLMEDYHDKEWGTPLHDDKKLYEFLILDGFQAGLSWKTILNKREAFRDALDGFDYIINAKYDDKKIEELMNNPNIIRNHLKINAVIKNAKSFMKIQDEFGSFDKYLWAFVDNKPIQNKWKSWEEVPGKTPLSEKISKDLKKRGFSFVGPTIIYAYLQAVGVVLDHLIYCYRYKELVSK